MDVVPSEQKKEQLARISKWQLRQKVSQLLSKQA